MNDTLRTLLKATIKDMGLTSKALDDLTEIASSRLEENPTEEDIKAVVASVTPFAKAMQAEITRKSQRKRNEQSANKQSNQEGEGDGTEAEWSNDGSELGNDAPAWFKAYQQATDQKIQSLISENNAMKAEKASQQRATDIATKARELGIPEYLMKRIQFSDDADIDKELNDFKQDLVTNSLLPQSAAGVGDPEANLKEDATHWAESLPDLG